MEQNDDYCLYYIRNTETGAVLGFPDYPTTWGNPKSARRHLNQWNRRDARSGRTVWELVCIDLRAMTLSVIGSATDETA